MNLYQNDTVINTSPLILLNYYPSLPYSTRIPHVDILDSNMNPQTLSEEC